MSESKEISIQESPIERKRREAKDAFRHKAWEACEKFDMEGITFTHQDIRKYVGYGSLTDIGFVVRDYRREKKLKQVQHIAVPENLKRLGDRILQEYWADAEREASHKVEAVEEKARQDKTLDEELISTIRIEKDELQAKVNDLTTTNSNQAEQIKTLTEYKFEAVGKLASLEERIKSAKEHYRQLNDSYQAEQNQVEHLKTQLNTRTTELRQQQAALKDAETARTTLSEQVSQLNINLSERAAVIAELEDKLTRRGERCDELEAQKTELQGKITSLEEDKTAWTDRERDYLKEINVLEKQQASAETELKSTKGSLQKSEALNRSQAKQLSTLTADHATIAEQMKELERQKATHDEAYQATLKELDTTRAELNQAKAELKEARKKPKKKEP
ncbi:DNA-binding protein [Endozoicomonas lisbonensis]|uniref:Chromosome segregation ATPase n=1 Tax=Endozoicomonas lisbonensis TaxID=3120522 RepID=A0ABV2SPA6_9GAMM